MTHNPAEALRELLDTLKIHKANFYGGMWTERQRKDLMEAIHHGNEALLALTSPAPASAGPVLLDEARAHLAQSDEVISVMPNTTRAIIEGLLAAVSAPAPNESTLITIIADIREKSGVGSKPMLSELADAIAERIKPRPSPDVAGVKLADRVDLTGGVRPAHVLESLTESVNQAWAIIGDNARCSVPATFIGWLLQEYESLSAEKGRLVEALTPSAETKAAYIGEFTFSLNAGLDEFGDDHIIKNVQVPWTTIKEIMAAIRARNER